MARRRLPYADDATLDQAVLFSGEVAVDVTEHRLRVGDGITPGGFAMARKDEVLARVGLSAEGLLNPSTWRGQLGLGDAALKNMGTAAGQVADGGALTALQTQVNDLSLTAGTSKVVTLIADLASLTGVTPDDMATVTDDPAGNVVGGNGIWAFVGPDPEDWVWKDYAVPSIVRAKVETLEDDRDFLKARVQDSDDQAGAFFTDARRRLLKAFLATGAELGKLYSILPSETAGLRVIDVRGRYVDIGDDPAEAAVAPDLKPYVGPAIYAAEGEPSHFVLSGMLADRTKACERIGVLRPATGAPVEFGDAVTFDAASLGGSAKIIIGPCVGTRYGESASMPVRIAPAAGSASPVILTLGDSIPYRGVMHQVNARLVAQGLTPTWVGTLLSSGASDGSTSGGVLGEPKPGFELGDFTNQADPSVPPLAPGQEATYAGLSVAAKRAYNTLLRDPDGGDAPEDIVNGYVVDFDFYFTRHGLTPATLLWLSLWTNDITAVSIADIRERMHDGYALMIRRWRAYHPTHPVVITLPGTAETPEREAYWPKYVEAIKAVMRAVADAADPNVHLVFTAPHVTGKTGYDLTADSATPDPDTGAVERQLPDGIHPTGTTREAVTDLSAAALSYAAHNIVT